MSAITHTMPKITRTRLPFSVVAKPTGAACNLDCDYCFFLSKELLYNVPRQLMSEETARTYIQEFLAASPDGDVTMLWQGGEPTLRGLPFFRKVIAMCDELRRPTQHVTHALQTNGTLIDEEWARFLREHDFLVGISIDGPEHIHDTYRVNKGRRGTHSLVVRGWNNLKKAGVRTNILCTVHHANQDHPLEVYRYFRDVLGAEHIQFIPIVERVERENLAQAEAGWRPSHSKEKNSLAGTRLLYLQTGDAVTSRSVDPHAYGTFLTTIFDEWVLNDVGRIFIQDFDAALNAMFGIATVCVHAPSCGNNFALEFNGDVYTCDHWVEPDWKLGNIADEPFADLAASERMQRFSLKKNAELTEQCRACPFLRLCYGGCPKDRFVEPKEVTPKETSTNSIGRSVSIGRSGPDAPKQNYLCPGYYSFYKAIRPDLVAMARLIRSGRAPADIMDPHVRAALRPRQASSDTNKRVTTRDTSLPALSPTLSSSSKGQA
ncbi:anaerobic sulfatase maturase [Arcanobacterium haemolyticum]|nr:anaerobic sulfatase maturase [Arcanobacterium haemolyticum]